MDRSHAVVEYGSNAVRYAGVFRFALLENTYRASPLGKSVVILLCEAFDTTCDAISRGRTES